MVFVYGILRSIKILICFHYGKKTIFYMAEIRTNHSRFSDITSRLIVKFYRALKIKDESSRLLLQIGNQVLRLALSTSGKTIYLSLRYKIGVEHWHPNNQQPLTAPYSRQSFAAAEQTWVSHSAPFSSSLPSFGRWNWAHCPVSPFDIRFGAP